MNKYEEKIAKAKEWLGERWLLHPNYKPLPWHTVIIVDGRFKYNAVTPKGIS